MNDVLTINTPISKEMYDDLGGKGTEEAIRSHNKLPPSAKLHRVWGELLDVEHPEMVRSVPIDEADVVYYQFRLTGQDAIDWALAKGMEVPDGEETG